MGTFNATGGTVSLIGTLANTGNTLAITAATGSLTLYGGTILGGTVTATGGAELVATSSGGTLSGVTVNGPLDLTANGATATVTNGLTLNGTAMLGNAAGSTYGTLNFTGTQTLAGTGTVVFGKSASNNALIESTAGATLTIGPLMTVRGSSGTLGGTSIVNQGTISADDSGGAAGSFVYDQGFSGGSTESTSDTINTSGVTNPAPQAVYQTARYGSFSYTLSGLTAESSYTVALDFSDSWVTAAGQRQFNVSINGTQVLTNFDIYAAAGGKDTAIQKTFSATANASGQIAVAFSTGSIGNPLINGIEVLSAGVALQQINCGLLAGGTITISPTTFSNQGTLLASKGETLNVGGMLAQLGTFDSTGGTMNVTGTLNNSGSTLALSAATGSLTLSGTVLGGTISESGGAELIPAAGTLSGVTLNGPLDLTASSANAYVTNGLTLNGTATLGPSARVYFVGGSQTLGGTGTVVFNNATYQGLIADANNMTLTIGAGITIVGGNNQGNNVSSGSVIGYSSDFGGGSNASIVNLGTINAGTSGMSIVVNTNGSFTNQGTLQAAGGTLDLNGAWSNAGTIQAQNSGTVSAAMTPTNYVSGTLTGGTWNVLAGATISITGAAIATNDGKYHSRRGRLDLHGHQQPGRQQRQLQRPHGPHLYYGRKSHKQRHPVERRHAERDRQLHAICQRHAHRADRWHAGRPVRVARHNRCGHARRNPRRRSDGRIPAKSIRQHLVFVRRQCCGPVQQRRQRHSWAAPTPSTPFTRPTTVNLVVTVVPFVDLVVTQIQGPSQLVAGLPGTVTWTVTNQGNTATTAVWHDAVYLSADGQIDANAILLATQAEGTTLLGPNSSYQTSATFTVPLGQSARNLLPDRRHRL